MTHSRRMRSLVTRIVIDEERLRRALAAELHTGLGQEIALAKLKLSSLREGSVADLGDPLREIEQLVEQADRSLRSITFRISPPSLHDLGLVAALQWLAEDISQRYGIDVRIEDDASPLVLDESIRVILFRAIRELLINAAIHSKVREVLVCVSGVDDLVRIRVADTGCGFDAADLEQRGHGLFGMREQLSQVDGTLEIDSTPENGTLVTLTAPSGAAVEPLAT